MAIPAPISDLAGINFSQTYTPPLTGAYNFGTSNPDFVVGVAAMGQKNSNWVYCLIGAGGVTGLGYVVTINSAFTAVMMSNSVGAIGDRVGVAPAACAAGDYAWIQVNGIVDQMRASAASGANAPLASSVTAGAVSATVTTPTKNLLGMWFTAAPGAAGLFAAELNWPTVGTTN
jgi:hypothetical protein